MVETKGSSPRLSFPRVANPDPDGAANFVEGQGVFGFPDTPCTFLYDPLQHQEKLTPQEIVLGNDPPPGGCCFRAHVRFPNGVIGRRRRLSVSVWIEVNNSQPAFPPYRLPQSGQKRNRSADLVINRQQHNAIHRRARQAGVGGGSQHHLDVPERAGLPGEGREEFSLDLLCDHESGGADGAAEMREQVAAACPYIGNNLPGVETQGLYNALRLLPPVSIRVLQQFRGTLRGKQRRRAARR